MLSSHRPLDKNKNTKIYYCLVRYSAGMIQSIQLCRHFNQFKIDKYISLRPIWMSKQHTTCWGNICTRILKIQHIFQLYMVTCLINSGILMCCFPLMEAAIKITVDSFDGTNYKQLRTNNPIIWCSDPINKTYYHCQLVNKTDIRYAVQNNWIVFLLSQFTYICYNLLLYITCWKLYKQMFIHDRIKTARYSTDLKKIHCYHCITVVIFTWQEFLPIKSIKRCKICRQYCSSGLIFCWLIASIVFFFSSLDKRSAS